MIVALFTDLLPAGGIQRAGRHTAAVLASFARERGWPYEFLSLNDSLGDHELYLGDLPVRFRGFRRNKIRFVAAALRLAWERPRLLLAIHPHLAPVSRAMRVFAPKIRSVTVAHGVEVWTPLAAHRRWSLRASDLVLAPSSDTAGNLASAQGVDPRKIRLLAWGLDPDFAVTPTQIAGGTPAPPGFPSGRVVLTVGRLALADRYKGMDHLIAALPRLVVAEPAVQLVIVGDGPDRARLESLASEHRVVDRVHFLGEVASEALRACYESCDVFALPSRGEGFGLVFLEAMAYGKPVVGGAHGGTPDVITDGETGYLVPHGDSDRLVAVLSGLLADPGLRQQVGERGRQRVHSEFLFDHFAARLRRILEELCAS